MIMRSSFSDSKSSPPVLEAGGVRLPSFTGKQLTVLPQRLHSDMTFHLMQAYYIQPKFTRVRGAEKG